MSGESVGTLEVKVVETDKVEFEKPLVILGFAGAGLVGGIAVSHIIDQLGMKKIAHVQSRYLPPAVVFMEGKLKHPFRIYSDDAGKLCAVVCEIPFRSDGVYPIASTLVDWIEEQGAEELIILEGVGVRIFPKERKAFCAAEPEKVKQCEKKGVKMITAGIIQGIAGSILNECLTREITGMAFLTHAVAFMPDPEGATVLINALNDFYDLNVDTKQLLDKAEEIKQRLKEVAQRHQKMRKAEEKRGVPERFYV
ncbi:MAG: proteasome assembly chaperone family protein [Candidatus Bathyarchaeia archaeon]